MLKFILYNRGQISFKTEKQSSPYLGRFRHAFFPFPRHAARLAFNSCCPRIRGIVGALAVCINTISSFLYQQGTPDASAVSSLLEFVKLLPFTLIVSSSPLMPCYTNPPERTKPRHRPPVQGFL